MKPTDTQILQAAAVVCADRPEPGIFNWAEVCGQLGVPDLDPEVYLLRLKTRGLVEFAWMATKQELRTVGTYITPAGYEKIDDAAAPDPVVQNINIENSQVGQVAVAGGNLRQDFNLNLAHPRTL